MHRMLRSTAWSLLLPAALLASAPAEPPAMKTEADAKALVERCLQRFVAEDYAGGLDLLRPYWKAPKSEVDTLTMQTLTSRSMVKARFGASLGTEFISQQKAGASFLRFMAIEKLQNTAIRYSVVFYKATDHWELQTFVWDDKVQLLFGE